MLSWEIGMNGIPVVCYYRYCVHTCTPTVTWQYIYTHTYMCIYLLFLSIIMNSPIQQDNIQFLISDYYSQLRPRGSRYCGWHIFVATAAISLYMFMLTWRWYEPHLVLCWQLREIQDTCMCIYNHSLNKLWSS